MFLSMFPQSFLTDLSTQPISSPNGTALGLPIEIWLKIIKDSVVFPLAKERTPKGLDMEDLLSLSCVSHSMRAITSEFLFKRLLFRRKTLGCQEGCSPQDVCPHMDETMPPGYFFRYTRYVQSCELRDWEQREGDQTEVIEAHVLNRTRFIMSNIPKLTALILSQTLVTPSALKNIRELSSLSTLIFERCRFRGVSADDIRNLVSQLGPRLRTLSVWTKSGHLGEMGMAFFSPSLVKLKKLRMNAHEHIQSVLSGPVLESLETLEVLIEGDLTPLFQYLNRLPSLVSLTIEDQDTNRLRMGRGNYSLSSLEHIRQLTISPLLLEHLTDIPPELSSLAIRTSIDDAHPLLNWYFLLLPSWSRPDTYMSISKMTIPVQVMVSVSHSLRETQTALPNLVYLTIIMDHSMEFKAFQERVLKSASPWAAPSLKELRFIDVKLEDVFTEDDVKEAVQGLASSLRSDERFPAMQLFSMRVHRVNHWVDYYDPPIQSE
ncbi:hypothetical protein F5880DRAFT_1558778 [Lentinula raphanica]|nr:hypothetical protein F5880DRAFT_1558778 [Lentinula raphanica]